MFELCMQFRVFLNCHVAKFVLVWTSVVLEAPTLACLKHSWICALRVSHSPLSRDDRAITTDISPHPLSTLSFPFISPFSSSKHWFLSCIGAHIYMNELTQYRQSLACAGSN